MFSTADLTMRIEMLLADACRGQTKFPSRTLENVTLDTEDRPILPPTPYGTMWYGDSSSRYILVRGPIRDPPKEEPGREYVCSQKG